MASYKIQVDNEIRNATKEETAIIDAQRAESEALAEAQATKLATRQAVLDKLQLTENEVAALFG